MEKATEKQKKFILSLKKQLDYDDELFKWYLTEKWHSSEDINKLDKKTASDIIEELLTELELYRLDERMFYFPEQDWGY